MTLLRVAHAYADAARFHFMAEGLLTDTEARKIVRQEGYRYAAISKRLTDLFDREQAGSIVRA